MAEVLSLPVDRKRAAASLAATRNRATTPTTAATWGDEAPRRSRWRRSEEVECIGDRRPKRRKTCPAPKPTRRAAGECCLDCRSTPRHCASSMRGFEQPRTPPRPCAPRGRKGGWGGAVAIGEFKHGIRRRPLRRHGVSGADARCVAKSTLGVVLVKPSQHHTRSARTAHIPSTAEKAQIDRRAA